MKSFFSVVEDNRALLLITSSHIFYKIMISLPQQKMMNLYLLILFILLVQYLLSLLLFISRKTEVSQQDLSSILFDCKILIILILVKGWRNSKFEDLN
jgi:hypothetical protein